MTWSSVALLTPNAYRNLVQIAVPKISRKFQLSKKKTVENVQWGWNRSFIRSWRKRTDGSRGKLIFRASSYDNRLISFSNFSSTIRRPCLIFLPNVNNLTFSQRKAFSQSQRNPRKKDTFLSTHVWLPSAHILPRWIQGMIGYWRINVLTIGDLIFRSICNTKCKQ